MDLVREGFVRLDTREPLQGVADDLKNEVFELVRNIVADSSHEPGYLHIDDIYQRGREYFFDLRLQVDLYDVEADVDYDDRWKIGDICGMEQKVREDLENVEMIRLPDHLDRFYLRETNVRTRIYPYNDAGEGTTMNYDIVITIRGELIDVASLTRKSARGF